MRQRVTAIALIPLAILFILPFANTLGAAQADVVATYSNPLHALVAVLLLATVFIHLNQGLHEVIEDYVHGKAALVIATVANQTFCWAFGLVGIIAIARIALFH